MAFNSRASKDDAGLFRNGVNQNGWASLIHSLILGARSGYLAAEKTRKLDFER
jgi:hypothetical protein